MVEWGGVAAEQVETELIATAGGSWCVGGAALSRREAEEVEQQGSGAGREQS